MKKIVSLLVATTLFMGCASEDVSAPSNEMRVSVNVDGATQLDTKGGTGLITQSNLAVAGKTIDVFILGAGYNAAPTPTVVTCAVNSTVVSWGTASSIYLSGNQASVYAYFPSELIPATSGATQFKAPLTAAAGDVLSIASGTTAQNIDGSNQTDFLYMNNNDRNANKVSNASAATATANIKLNHAMAKLNFVLKLHTDYPTTATAPTDATVPVVSAVSLVRGSAGATRNFYVSSATSTFDVSTGEFGNMTSVPSLVFGGTAKVNLKSPAPSTNTITVLVAPQTTNILNKEFAITATIDGRTYNAVDLPAVLVSSAASKWEAGKEYTYYITVTPTAMTVNSTVSVASWSNTDINSATPVEFK